MPNRHARPWREPAQPGRAMVPPGAGVLAAGKLFRADLSQTRRPGRLPRAAGLWFGSGVGAGELNTPAP